MLVSVCTVSLLTRFPSPVLSLFSVSARLQSASQVVDGVPELSSNVSFPLVNGVTLDGVPSSAGVVEAVDVLAGLTTPPVFSPCPALGVEILFSSVGVQ